MEEGVKCKGLSSGMRNAHLTKELFNTRPSLGSEKRRFQTLNPQESKPARATSTLRSEEMSIYNKNLFDPGGGGDNSMVDQLMGKVAIKGDLVGTGTMAQSTKKGGFMIGECRPRVCKSVFGTLWCTAEHRKIAKL